jgi:hypothetical protein
MELRTPVVIDVGTGSTKLGALPRTHVPEHQVCSQRWHPTLIFTSSGFGGNLRPSYVFPTCVATKHQDGASSQHSPSDFVVGPGSEHRTALYDVVNPVKRGTVVNWPEYEKLMFGCLCECVTST